MTPSQFPPQFTSNKCKKYIKIINSVHLLNSFAMHKYSVAKQLTKRETIYCVDDLHARYFVFWTDTTIATETQSVNNWQCITWWQRQQFSI